MDQIHAMWPRSTAVYLCIQISRCYHYLHIIAFETIYHRNHNESVILVKNPSAEAIPFTKGHFPVKACTYVHNSGHICPNCLTTAISEFAR